MATVSKWAALQALQTALKAIRGPAAGYYYSVEGRVFLSMVIPGDDAAAVPFPYICVPLIGEDPEILIDDTYVNVKWHARIHVFVAEQPLAVGEFASVEAAAKIHDDVWKALMADWTLGGAVRDSGVVDVQSAAGVLPDEMPYGEVMFDLLIYQKFARADIGP